MNFKKPKEEILSEVFLRVDNRIRRHIYDAMYNAHYQQYGGPGMAYGHQSPGNALPVIEPLVSAMSQAVVEAVRCVLENTYTDQEFEEDLTLREKK